MAYYKLGNAMYRVIEEKLIELLRRLARLDEETYVIHMKISEGKGDKKALERRLKAIEEEVSRVLDTFKAILKILHST